MASAIRGGKEQKRNRALKSGGCKNWQGKYLGLTGGKQKKSAKKIMYTLQNWIGRTYRGEEKGADLLYHRSGKKTRKNCQSHGGGERKGLKA